MKSVNPSPAQGVGGVGALIWLFAGWRSGARRAKAAAEAARSGARLVSLAGLVLLNAGLIVEAQCLVIAHPGSRWLLLAVLGLPALFASYSLTRAMTVTTVDTSRRKGGRR